MGAALHYRLGMAAIRRLPILWIVSKAFLVIAVKDKQHTRRQESSKLPLLL